MRTEFDCTECKRHIVYEREGDCGGTGYATRTDDGGKEGKVCYPCCGKIDRTDMITNGRADMYLTGGKIGNWPGTLSYKVLASYKSKSWGFGGAMNRVDAWFRGPDGFIWHAIQRGDMDLCRCRRTKRAKL